MPPTKQINRATNACVTCRKYRSRCIVHQDSEQCVRCKNQSIRCVFDFVDGRKKVNRINTNTKIESMSKRIQELEQLVKDQSNSLAAQTPPAYALQLEGPSTIVSTEHGSRDGATPSAHQGDGILLSNSSESSSSEAVQRSTGSDEVRTITNLLPFPVRFDLASGRVRCFGSTASMNVLTKTSLIRDSESREAHWPISLVVPHFSPETHDYLLELYWTCHNSVIHVVHKTAFEEDQKNGKTQFYSLLLDLAMVAVGFRYADKSRSDIQSLALPGSASSVLHEKARSMAKLEMERPGGLTSIQALVLLGDVECSIGRDDTGWLYAGMALRLVFDVGLHVDPEVLHLSEREAQIRHMILWACIVIDIYWSLYLGRPTVLKTSDIASSCLSLDFRRLISTRPFGHEKQPETRVYEAFLSLMRCVGPLCDLKVKQHVNSKSPFSETAAVDRDLNAWHAALPDGMRWTANNIEHMPASFFLLHTQFHAALVLLHRPFVRYADNNQGKRSAAESETQYTALLSRNVCLQNAKHIVSIFKIYRQRFSMSRVFLTGLQHAGTAATTLMAEILMESDKRKMQELLELLECLNTTIGLMSDVHQPASTMFSVVEQFVRKVLEDRPLHRPPTNVRDSANVVQAQTTPCSLRESGDGSEAYANSRKSPLNSPRTAETYESQAHFSYGLPLFPSSWFEDFTAKDSEFLSLVSGNVFHKTLSKEISFGANLDDNLNWNAFGTS